MNMEQFRKIYADWQASGQPVKTYTAALGIPSSNFFYWKKKLLRSQGLEVSRSGSFMRVEGSRLSATSSSCHQLVSPALCEIVYPNGVMVRITSDLSVEDLRSLISLSR